MSCEGQCTQVALIPPTRGQAQGDQTLPAGASLGHSSLKLKTEHEGGSQKGTEELVVGHRNANCKNTLEYGPAEASPQEAVRTVQVGWAGSRQHSESSHPSSHC